MKFNSNKKVRVLIYFTILLVILSIIAGCSVNKSNQNISNNSGKKENTITVTDSIGRHVKVPAKVNRIACLYAFSGHVTTMLGRGKDIVAVVNGLKRDKLLTDMYPGIKKALVPSMQGKINIEELLNADPDVVFIQGKTARDADEVKKLKEFNIPYLVVEYKNIKEQQYAIEMIGKAIGRYKEAKQYNEFYQQCIEQVQKKLKDLPEEQKVRVYHSVNEAVRTDTKDSLAADWLRVAGGKDVSVKKNLKLLEGKHFASLEQILLWDPDVIIANEMGVANYIMTNKQWSSLTAVKNKKVYQMPNGISRWGHPGSLETPLAILWTAKTLYPNKFTDIDMVKETKNFYDKFFNYKLTGDIVSQILSGNGMRIPKSQM